MKPWLKRSFLVLALVIPGAVYGATQLTAAEPCPGCPVPCPMPCP